MNANLPAPSTCPPECTLETVYLGRQALYDRSLNSRAYELFYRQEPPDSGIRRDQESETCSVVLSAFAEMDLGNSMGDKRFFLQVSHDVITGALPLPVSPERVVLQVKDYHMSTRELMAALAARRVAGFQVALEGFEYSERTAPLLAVCDYVKLNAQRLGTEGLRAQVDLLKVPRVVAVATQLESAAEFRAATRAGCRLLQGSFLFRPQILSHKRLPKSLEVVTRLLKLLRDPNVLLFDVEKVVKSEPSLGIAVLRFLGSASFGLKHSVTSVAHAVGLLGVREFSKWLTVVALTSTSKRPNELSLVALTRARACELLAKQVEGAEPEAAFTVGLFSMLEALFERPLAMLLEQLPVSDEMTEAVREHQGPLGEVLTAVLSCEHAPSEAQAGKISAVTLNNAWLEALRWAERAQESLG